MCDWRSEHYKPSPAAGSYRNARNMHLHMIMQYFLLYIRVYLYRCWNIHPSQEAPYSRYICKNTLNMRLWWARLLSFAKALWLYPCGLVPKDSEWVLNHGKRHFGEKEEIIHVHGLLLTGRCLASQPLPIVEINVPGSRIVDLPRPSPLCRHSEVKSPRVYTNCPLPQYNDQVLTFTSLVLPAHILSLSGTS